MNMRTLSFAAAMLTAAAAIAIAQGPLNPPGPPAPTMKSLDEIDAKTEKRIPISSLPFKVTASGSYYLTGNLTGVDGQNGIEVDAPDVTIDLNGFSLSGPGDEAITGGARLTVRNGTVNGWRQIGIASPSVGAVIEHVRVNDSGNLGIAVGPQALVQSCTVISTGAIAANGRGISAGAGSVVSKCTVVGLRGVSAIAIRAGEGSTVVDCTVRDSDASTGVGISTGNACSVTRCEVTANAALSAGINVGNNSRVVDCVSTSNTSASGIVGGQRSLISGCTASNNGANGISVAGASVVSNSVAADNTAAGIRATGNNNRLEGNNTVGNDGAGIQVPTTDGDNLIIKNSSGANLLAEFDVALGNAFGPVATRASVTDGTNTNPHANFDVD